MNADITLANDLNAFCTHFEINQRDAALFGSDKGVLKVTEHDVRLAFKRVNPRKAVGPDGISGRVLKSCAQQLAPVFTVIFNLSLSLCKVPACFKKI